MVFVITSIATVCHVSLLFELSELLFSFTVKAMHTFFIAADFDPDELDEILRTLGPGN